MLFKKNPKAKETIIDGNSTIEGNFISSGHAKIYGKVNGNVKVNGNLTILETGVVLGTVEAKNVNIAGTVEGDVNSESLLHLSSSAKLSGDAYVKQMTMDEGCLFSGKCIMPEMENLKKSSKKIDKKNFDMSTPNEYKKKTIISELEKVDN